MKILGRTALIVLILALVGFLPPLHADTCSDAKDAAQKYIDLYEDIRKLIPEEQKQFVEAVCAADDDARASVMEDAGHRVEGHVLDKAGELNRLHDDASKALGTAVDNDECQGSKDDLTKLQDRVEEISKRIDTMSNGVRGGSNPVFSVFRELGQKMHQEYQSMHSTFDNGNSKYGNAEVELREIGRKVDFMDPEGCQVVELKPDANSSAQSDGFDDAKTARDWLNDPANLAKFVQSYPKYAKCTKFVARVDCYHYCPVVLEDGFLQLGSIDWKAGCKGPE